MRLLSTPLRIRSLELKNRVILPPMAYIKGDDQSRVTPELCAYYHKMAEAGFGLIVTEHCFVSPEGQASARQLSVSRDSDIEGMSRLADSIHSCGEERPWLPAPCTSPGSGIRIFFLTS